MKVSSQLNHLALRDVDLVEACAALSKAVWYLEEGGMAHGNIRAANVFVAGHDDAAFKVKLGDQGLRSVYEPEEVRCHVTLKYDIV